MVIKWQFYEMSLKQFIEPSFSELEKIGEACQGEDFEKILVRTGDGHFMAARLGILENAEENAKTAGGDILQFLAVEYNILVHTKDSLDVFLRLRRGGGIEAAFKEDLNLVIMFFKSGFHFIAVFNLFFSQV